MKSKKILIIFIAIVVALILAIGGTIFAYAMTDFLKSDEQLFYKYIGQVQEKLSNFENKELEEYFLKTEETPYESEGKLTVSVKAPIDEKISKLVNDLNITFSGKTDKKQNKTEQEISINYSDDVSFPIEYVKTGDLYGITSNILITKYLAIRTDKEDSKDILNQDDNESVINRSEKIILAIDNNNIDKKDVLNILQILKTSISENVTEDNYSKIDDNSFALILDNQEIKSISTKILQELENNKYLTKEEANKFMEKIGNVPSTNEEALKLIVNKNGIITLEVVNYVTIKIEFINNNEIVMSTQNDNNQEKLILKKNSKENEVTYKIEYITSKEENKDVFYFEANYSNLTSQIAKETYKFGMGTKSNNSEIIYDYTYDITKSFEENIDIKTIGNDNAVILTDMTDEYNNTLINTLTSKIDEINKTQMESLGIKENQNPLIIASPTGYIISWYMNLGYNSIEDTSLNNEMEIEQEGSSMKDIINRGRDFINSNS